MERIRNQLKALSRQYNFYQKNRQRVANNLIWLLSQSFPWTAKIIEVNRDLDIESIELIDEFWHSEIIRDMSFTDFDLVFKKQCQDYGIEYTQENAREVFENIRTEQPKLPYDENTKFLIKNMIKQLKIFSETAENLRQRLIRTSEKMPEYPIVMQMPGITPITGAIIMAEIGDIKRFDKRTAITAFAGIDPNTLRNTKDKQSVKGGKTDLKKALHEVIENILEEAYEEDPVYQFMQKKRLEGKSEPVCKTAGTNKFLRIYYGKIKSSLG